jgi:hypothetical protein
LNQQQTQTQPKEAFFMTAKRIIVAIFTTFALLCLAAQARAQQSGEPAAQVKCAEGEELQNDICYPKCKDKFKGDGPMCKEICAPNTQDAETHCLSGPAVFRKKNYERGPGRPLK